MKPTFFKRVLSLLSSVVTKMVGWLVTVVRHNVGYHSLHQITIIMMIMIMKRRSSIETITDNKSKHIKTFSCNIF